MGAKSRPSFRAESAPERPSAGEGLEGRIPALIEAWRRERRSRNGGPLSEREVEEVGRALLGLQRGLTGDRRLAGSGYMDDAERLGAYLLYYWPVSYLQVSLALSEFPPPSGCGRILDLGSGPGPASAAILDALRAAGARRGGAGPAAAPELVLADASPRALELAASILERGDNRPSALRRELLDLESGSSLPEGPFDLIVAGHCLNELWRGHPDALGRREELLLRAGERLSPGGLLLLLEPSLLSTSRELIALRDRLAAASWRVLGPCPGSYPCPALAAGPDRTCHAQAAWAPPPLVASLAAAAGLDRDSVKFAYFLLQPPGPGEGGAGASDRLAGEGAQDERAEAPLRVVSDPMLNKAGRLRYHLCGEGRLVTLSARADDEAARAAGFMSLGRGDLLRPLGFEARDGGGLGFVPGSGSGSGLEILRRAPEAPRSRRGR